MLNVLGKLRAQNQLDLSMLTNHASLVNWAFKQVGGITANLSCQAQADDQRNLHVYGYQESVKTLDHIKEVVSRDPWWVNVVNVTDFFMLSVTLYKTNDLRVIDADPSMRLFQGWGSARPEKNQYGNWELPRSATTIPLFLADKIRIPVPGIIDARLIVQDSQGNRIPVVFEVESDALWFTTSQAGNGVLVITYLAYNSEAHYYYYDKKAYDLATGREIPLSRVFIQMLVKGSAHIIDFKNTNVVSTFVWDDEGYGTVPLLQAVFTSPTTNVTFSLTTASGLYAKSFDVEDQATGKKVSFAIMPETSTAYAGTNVFKGVYNIVPQGVDLKTYLDL